MKKEKEKNKASKKLVHQLDDSSSSDSEVLNLSVNSLGERDDSKITVSVNIQKQPITMELDTGSAVILINYELYKRNFSDVQLRQTRTTLRSFSGNIMKPQGVIYVRAKHNGQSYSNMRLFVVKCRTPALFGRDWLQSIRLNWSEINELQKAKWIESDAAADFMARITHPAVKKLVSHYSSVFEPGIGKLKAPPATFQIKEHTPKFCKARTVPFAQGDKVKAELDRLDNEGIISPNKFSKYATLIVPIPKSNGRVRLCGDFKVTLNQIIEPEQYPLPVIDEIFAMFEGCQKFNKIDLTEAYLAYEIHPNYCKFLTISTPHGLYEFNRLVYGISDAPAKWQKMMDQVLDGIPFVATKSAKMACIRTKIRSMQ